MKKRMSGTLIFCLVLILAAVQCQLVTSIINPNGQNQQPTQARNQNNNPTQNINHTQQPTLRNNQIPTNTPARNTNNPPLPTQGNNQNQNNNQGFDPANFDVTGIWTSYDQTSAGPVSTELILELTGTFSQTVTWGDLMTLDTGTYVVGDGFIHFYVDYHQPQVYNGQPMSWVDSFTYFFTPVDENTMYLEDHIVGTAWTVYRQ